MKKPYLVILLISLISVLVFAACSPKETMEEAPAAVEDAVEESTDMNTEDTMETNTDSTSSGEIDVEALIKEKVDGNHDLERIFGAEKTRDEWVETLDRMIGYGAQINDEEKELIINYLLEKQN